MLLNDKKVMELKRNFFFKCMLALMLSVFTCISWSGVAHNNQLLIQKDQPKVLQLDFTVNLCQMLHQWLAPSTPFVNFLQKYATLPDEAFQKELGKAIKKFEAESFVMQGSGFKQGIKLANFPASADLKKLLQQNLMILDLPGNLQAHMEPIVFSASLKSKFPLQRAQLFISPSVFPIQVQYQQDVLWLTTQIPMALYDF
jgi:hypothetical protein